jgi:two-component system, chemotaxis family, sensor kinase CheA
MADELDELWREFAAETQDHLEIVDRLLSDRHDAAWTGDEIAQLFRSFHSLKGAFLAVGFVNLEAVAHRAEDILALAREGRVALDASASAMLLRAVDRLTEMRDRAVARRSDVEPAGDLLTELDRWQGVAPAAPAPDEAAAPLTEDAEMLALYCELLMQRAPELALALGAPDDRESAADTAEQLAVGADMLGFESLAADLLDLAEAARAGPASLDRLDALREQVAMIEEITGIPTGAIGLADAIAPHREDGSAALDRLAEALYGGEIGAVAGAAAQLRQRYAAQGLAHASEIALRLEERFSRGQTEDPAWIAAAAEAAYALRSAAAEGRDLDEAELQALRAGWPDAARQPSNRSGARRGGFPLEPEVLSTLSEEQLDRLEAARRQGNLRAYDLLLELENDVEIGNDLLTWLADAVETVTSRTVIRQGRSGFEFLILSAETLDWIRAQITAIDPEQRCFRDLREAGQVIAPVPATAAPAASPLIRVSSESIDRLMTEIGEMRIGLAQLGQTLHRGGLAERLQALRGVTDQLAPETAAGFGEQLDAIGRTLHQMAELELGVARAHRRIWQAGLALRVVPIETLFGRLPRTVRDLAQKLGKEVELGFEGRDVRIDKSLIDLLVDPLMHMVRNALDHGIETPERRREAGKPERAQLRLTAAEHADGIHIGIADDGQGIDRNRILAKAVERGLISSAEAAGLSEPEALALIFRPGFSTAEAVTDISGRGVGMDVVANTLERLGGNCEVETSLGQGTRFTLKLPVSAALMTALLFKVDDEVLALPERQIAAVAELEPHQIVERNGVPTIRHQDRPVPLRDLAPLIGFQARPRRAGEPVRAIIISVGDRKLALAVDQIEHFQDLFLKELHPMLATLPAVAGASELGDGRPVLVLDAEGLGALAAGG